ncbi:von willebrand factor a domain-containing protein 5a [Anaeramoeba ignava]|uniref:von willebrand factor a domain-containing protein 5a n=1 Tax=Anaeramoeba ignava TaxID=1746090 RepID=A0A9Q0LY70_ANAIG|nr:von willebrand factor a domain-containing protein 5a [Anaeramoeba ignava]
MTGLIDLKTRSQIPLKGTVIDCSIRDFTGIVSVSQRYENESNFPIETIFNFPLDSSSAICQFEVFLGEKHIIGKVKEKEKAREIYDDAIAQGHTAIKMEEEKEDIFTMNVGNLLPKTQCIVIIRYTTILKETSDKGYRFFLPTIISPRYIPQKYGETNPSYFWNLKEIPGGYTANFHIEMTSNIVSVESTTHKIYPNILGQNCEFSIKPQENESQKDLEIIIHEQDPNVPRILTEFDKDSSVSMITLFPTLSEYQNNVEIIFLVDRSGSMSGLRIQSVRETLNVFLHSLPQNSYFNIYGFGSNFEKLFDKSEKYNDATLEKAKNHAENLQADLGGTEIGNVLNEVFQTNPVDGYSRQIFLLTDGDVSNTSEVIQIVQKNSQLARVFTFGIGHGASKALVEGVARAGRGEAEFILETKDIRRKVVQQLKKAIQKTITDLEINFENLSHKPESIAPFKLPPIFANQRFLFFVFWGASLSDSFYLFSNSKVVLSGFIGNEKIQWILEMGKNKVELANKFNDVEKIPLFHILGAKLMIKDLEERTSLFHDENGELKKEFSQKDVDQKIIELAKKYNLVSSKTSFIAVVENEDVDSQKESQEMVLNQINLEMEKEKRRIEEEEKMKRMKEEEMRKRRRNEKKRRRRKKKRRI